MGVFFLELFGVPGNSAAEVGDEVLAVRAPWAAEAWADDEFKEPRPFEGVVGALSPFTFGRGGVSS